MQLADKDDRHAEPIIAVLARIHAELDEIGRRIDHNQAMIAKSTWSVASGDADYVRAMQDADLSAQRIAGVADFLRALGQASPPHWRVDTSHATSQLKLSELVRSIGAANTPAAAQNAPDPGDVDLF